MTDNNKIGKENMSTNTTDQQLRSYIQSLDTRMTNTEEKVSELAAQNARLESNDQAIISRLDNVAEQMHEFTRLVSTPKQVNIVGWITMFLLVLATLGGIAMVVLNPIYKSVDNLEEYNEIDVGKKLDNAFELGRQTAELIELQEEMTASENRQAQYRKEFAEGQTSIRIEFNDRLIKLESKHEQLSNTVERLKD